MARDSDARTAPWQNLHHVALVTPDLDATIEFYGDLLSMQVGEVGRIGGPGGLRHCFIGHSVSAGGWGIHFFEKKDVDLFTDDVISRFKEMAMKNAQALSQGENVSPPAVNFVPGAMQHVAFGLPDDTAALELRQLLESHGVPTSETIATMPPIKFFLFPDNNGVILEVVWPWSSK